MARINTMLQKRVLLLSKIPPQKNDILQLTCIIAIDFLKYQKQPLAYVLQNVLKMFQYSQENNFLGVSF